MWLMQQKICIKKQFGESQKMVHSESKLVFLNKVNAHLFNIENKV